MNPALFGVERRMRKVGSKIGEERTRASATNNCRGLVLVVVQVPMCCSGLCRKSQLELRNNPGVNTGLY